jgi:hypothetical protein
MKFMTMVTTTNPDKAGEPPPALYQAIGELGMEAAKAGVLVENGGMALAGTVSVKSDQLIVDGPFTEAKELLGGYAIYELPTEAEAVQWTERFMQLHKQHWPGWEGEVVIRRLMEQPAG